MHSPTLSLIQPGVLLPGYSLICKRAGELDFILPKLCSSKSTTILIDATGIKVYGEGEWKVKVHGASKRRTWIKLHVAVDEKTQEIVGLEVTSSREADCKIGPEIINDLPSSVDTVIGDGGYDTRKCREAIAKIGAKDLIPPRKNSRLSKNLTNRNAAILLIKILGGDAIAKKIMGKT